MKSLKLFSDSIPTLVDASETHIFAANTQGIIKVVEIANTENEPEILEVPEDLTAFRVHNNLLFMVTALGQLHVSVLGVGFASILSTTVCYRSELSLRDLTVIDDARVVVAGDSAELCLVQINASSETVTVVKSCKLTLTDQARALSSFSDFVAVSSASGDTIFCKIPSLQELQNKDTDRDDIQIKILGGYSASYPKLVSSEDDSWDTESRLARNICSWQSPSLCVILSDKGEVIKGSFSDDSQFIKLGSVKSDSESLQLQCVVCPFNVDYVAVSQLDGTVQVWNLPENKQLTKLIVSEGKITSLCWYMHLQKPVLMVGTTNGSLFTTELDVPIPSFDGNSDMDISENELFGNDSLLGPTTSNGLTKRSHELLESDKEEDSDQEDGMIDFKADLSSVLPKYTPKPWSTNSSDWNKEQRILTANEYGSVIAESQGISGATTVNVRSSGKLWNDYYFVDSFGHDLAALSVEGLFLAQSKAKDGNSVGKSKKNRSIVVHIEYRPHKDESNGWSKTVSLLANELITCIAASRSFVFVFTSMGTARIYTRYGLLVSLEKGLPVAVAVANDRTIFTIACSFSGREFYYTVRDLVTSRTPRFLQKEEMLPMDFLAVPNMRADLNFDNVERQFEKSELKAQQKDDFVIRRDIFSELRFKTPEFPVHSVLFSKFGDPCVIDNGNILYVLTKWSRPGEAVFVPMLNLSEILIMRSHLLFKVLAVSEDCAYVSFFSGSNTPVPLPEPTEVPLKLPMTLAVDVKAVKEELKSRGKMGEDPEDIEDEDLLDEELLDEEEDEEISKLVEAELKQDEAFLRAKTVTELLTESLEATERMRRAVQSKFSQFKRIKMELGDSDEVYLNSMDLYLSDGDIEQENDSVRLPKLEKHSNAYIDKLEEIQSIYDKSLLQMFSDYCTSQEKSKARAVIRELKQDRALIAAGRIAERLELDDLLVVVNKERESRLD